MLYATNETHIKVFKIRSKGLSHLDRVNVDYAHDFINGEILKFEGMVKIFEHVHGSDKLQNVIYDKLDDEFIPAKIEEEYVVAQRLYIENLLDRCEKWANA